MNTIKTKRAKNIVNSLIGEVINVTDLETNITQRKFIGGLFGVGEIPSEEHVALSFERCNLKEKDECAAGLQTAYEDWERLIETGTLEIEGFIKVELVID